MLLRKFLYYGTYLLFNQIHACKYFTVVCCLLDLFLLAILGF